MAFKTPERQSREPVAGWTLLCPVPTWNPRKLGRPDLGLGSFGCHMIRAQAPLNFEAGCLRPRMSHFSHPRRQYEHAGYRQQTG
jgi:hypothetical protein